MDPHQCYPQITHQSKKKEQPKKYVLSSNLFSTVKDYENQKAWHKTYFNVICAPDRNNLSREATA